MLDDVTKDDKEHIVSWQPHGRSFTVHKPKEFVEKIMPTYFNQTKYASFQRQLNLYGFCRLTQGPDKGAYLHKCFVRGEQGLCRGMIRRKIKGTKVRRTLAPEEEPNFYSPEWRKRKAYEQEQQSFCTIPASLPRIKTRPLNAMQSALHTEYISELGDDSIQSSLAQVVSEESSSDSDDSCETEMEHQPMSQIRSLTRKSKTSETPIMARPGSCSHYHPTKAGDLLYFEGRPFHYLEHLDQIPPITIPNEYQTTNYET